jgi:hypothetical protein
MLLIVVAVAAVAAVFVDYTLEGSGAQGTVAESSAAPVPTSCTATFPSGLPLESGNNRTLFILRPGTTGLLCVTYTVNATAFQEGNITIQFQGAVDSVNATYTNSTNGEGYVYSYSFSPAPGVTDTANPAVVTFQEGSSLTTVTIIYTITASQDSAGFYSLDYPITCPALIPLAITDASQKVTAADFPGFFFPQACGKEEPLSNPRVTGLAGVNTTLIAA